MSPIEVMPETDVESELKKYPLIYKNHPDSEFDFCLAARYYYLTRKDDNTALIMAHAALKRHPDWAMAYYVLAQVQRARLEDEASLENLQIACKMRPRCLQLLLTCSEALRMDGKLQNALEMDDRAESLCKEAEAMKRYAKDPLIAHMHHKVRLDQGKIYFGQHDYKNATAVLEADVSDDKAVFKDKMDMLFSARLLAAAYSEEKQADKVLATLAKFPPVDKYDDDFYFLRGKAYAEKGQNQKAVDDLKVYLSMNAEKLFLPKCQRAIKMRAELYRRLGKNDLAARDGRLLRSEEKAAYKDSIFATKE